MGSVAGAGPGDDTTAPPIALQATRGRTAERLALALERLGLSCRVESREGLAIVHASASADAQLLDDVVRRRIVALGRECGFTHVAVALGAGTG